MMLIERAARALCRLDGRPEDDDLAGKPRWQSYLPQVRAVLAAIHEPCPKMAEAGAEVIRFVNPDEAALGFQGDAANVWRFMIDAMGKDISTGA
ncbi:hypothetical protein [Sphingobium estronivorans]|uniref:hypothetical protein n=1 Tax=Sphingobium estronivorans TaxID=1577690 RepID=UPI001F081F38|nr:hypothetical protein [Sphingobium estronivorans]